MLDISLVRNNPALIKKELERRGEKGRQREVDRFLELDKKWRKGLQEAEQLRKRRNELTQGIAELKEKGRNARKGIAEVRKIRERVQGLEQDTEKYRKESRAILMGLPNILHPSVPRGRDENDNRVIRKWGKPPRFGFRPKGHVEIAEGLGLMDLERAGKVSGAGFYYLKGELVLLDWAIMRYALDFLAKRGYTLIEPPLMLQRRPYEGVVDLGDFESVMYKMEGEGLYLIATSEHPMGAMHMGEVLDLRDLPVKLAGISPCFRREIGTHGKYTKGLFRVHHFNKVEQFVFCHPGDSWKLHEELQRNAEKLYQGLGLHYRVVNVCTGDIGSLAAKKYDIEAWMADREYREIGSNSNCTDYQARRLNIRYREKEGAPPAGFVHTLNNTALATSRTMVAILEQFQQADGSVRIPRALWPYMGGVRVLKKGSSTHHK
jgi:seryl-tRNA synthetase